MRRGRGPMLWVAAALVLAAAVHGALATSSWIGQPFSGFLLLENRVVPSAGLAHWPAVRGGEIYQHELLAIDGHPLRRAGELRETASSLPVGTPVSYRFRAGSETFERTIHTRRFTGVDYTLLFGSFLFCGLGLTLVSLTILFLRPEDPAARGSALSLWLIGMWALTATDLYGPYRLFRAHALFESLIFAGTFHLALVFPSPRRLALRHPWLVGATYAVGGVLALASQASLHDPDAYVHTHRLAMAAFGVAAFALIGALVWTFVRPPSFQARQRVKILALGSVAALVPQVVLSLTSSASGGQAPENLMGWSGIFFPMAVAYAVLRSDLLQVDAILRRTVNYALMTGIVTVGYAAVIAGLQPLLRSDAPGSAWTSALVLAVILAVVVLPLRDRIQSGVDRIFFRTSHDFRRIVDETSARLAAVTDLPVVARLIERVVREALAPESLTFDVATSSSGEIRPGDADTDSAMAAIRRGGDPRSRVIESEDGGLGVVFIAEGRLIAVMALGRPLSGRFYSGDDRRFLSTLANQGAVAIQNSLALLRLKELNLTLEQKVEERTAELATTLRELQQTQQQMVHQEKMASIGQLVAGVAHEINNPLNFIQGNLYHLRQYTDVLRRAVEDSGKIAKRADPEIQRALTELREELDLDYVLQDLGGIFEGCEEGVRRTTTIVKDLRTFSRNDSGPAVRVDPADALDTTLNLLRGRLTGIDVRREYQQAPAVECLESQMNQVFMNLVANAADAVGDAGTIVVRVAAAEPGTLRVEVEDDGCGIPEDQLERIFDPFYTTKEVGKGTGLGLAISYGVVTRHGGRIEVESRVGKGTLIRVQLPVNFVESVEEPDRPD